MSTLINYHGLQVVDPEPEGAGGLAIQNDFKALVDWHPKSVWAQSADPGVTNDVDEGYYPGSLWLRTNVTPPRLFVCKDNTDGAAVWVLVPLEVVQDTTPQLGGNLDVNDHQIVSVDDGDIVVMPDGTGNVGVGTATPQVLMHVVYPYAKSDTSDRIFAEWSSNDSSARWGLKLSGKGGSANSERVFTFQTHEAGVVNDGIVALQRYGGFVGVGTPTPVSKFAVDAIGETYGEISTSFDSANYPRVRGSLVHAGGSGGYASAGGLQIVAQGANISTGGSGAIHLLTPTGDSANGSTDATVAVRVSVLQNGSVGIGTTSPHATAKVQVDSTTQGFLPPRLTTTQRDNISSPAEGLLVWNTTTHALNVYDGSAWKAVTVT